ncbi:MAG: SGNH/GDSL hydrolase family protein [Anaerolineae bacterium]|nr:SGNH/GDSL hydrolase family protein [Anaerolineae bacterium]
MKLDRAWFERHRTLLRRLALFFVLQWAMIKWLEYMSRRPAPDSPLQYVHGGKKEPHDGKRVIVCVGDSITRGEVSYNYVELLQARLGDRFEVINAGINGEVSYDVLQRLGQVIACRPDLVTVLIGTNDANASIADKGALWMMQYRSLPFKPSIAWYEENMEAIVERLLGETRARIALLSLPPVGEDLQSRPVRTTRWFSEVVRRVARRYGVAYLPVFEQMTDYLTEHPPAEALEHEKWRWDSVKAIFEEKILGVELDEVAQRRGLVLHSDMLHLNSRGATLIADLIESLVRHVEADDRPEQVFTIGAASFAEPISPAHVRS